MKLIRTSAAKSGVASIYVVIFATILFGVIALSFIRIILSESVQTSNDDLSQSAYDSALAGVEDAKIAINTYYKCLSKAGGNPTSCNFDSLFKGNCEDFKLKNYLGYTYEDEVLIQEGNSNNANQAYTCVIIDNEVSDYRSTLTSDTRTRVVPIGIGNAELSKIRYVTFSWYSEINGVTFKNFNHGGKLANINSATTPPTISLTMLKTDANIDLNNYNTSNSGDYGTLVLLPTDGGVQEIGQRDITLAGMSDVTNNTTQVHCATGREFACSVTLGTASDPLRFTDGGNALLIISMPYGDTITDFAVELKDEHGNNITFVNVQISVDSTGKADQLLRRVESRLDPSDIFFPYPQYEVELTGDATNELRKFFWITQNCWTDQKASCDNNGSL